MEPNARQQPSFRAWVRDRAPLLTAAGLLFLAVAVLIVVEVLSGQ